MKAKKRYANGAMYRKMNTRSKYGAKKAERIIGCKTYTFDSQKEAKRFDELYMLQKAGKIESLRLQPKFLLQEGFRRDGKAYRAIHYIADFAYLKDGKEVVEDVKGHKTKEYQIKKKLFLKRYQEIDFREIV